jgi:hypothetical protein
LGIAGLSGADFGSALLAKEVDALREKITRKEKRIIFFILCFIKLFIKYMVQSYITGYYELLHY